MPNGTPKILLRLKPININALMFMGLSLSNILGVPFGTLIGQNFGWQMTFVVIAIIGVCAFIGH